MNEPIFFTPIAMERVWGGRRLATLPGKSLPTGNPIGELWEIVDRENAQSVVCTGPLAGHSLQELWTTHRAEIFGEAYLPSSAPRFPLLVKLLDASEKLSVQVHPPLHMAAELLGEPKTEVWYFLDSLPGANIYAGLKRGVTRARFEQSLASGTVEQTLHDIPVQTGESIFIPSGRLHAIGAGNMIIEIQQNSDTTYRVFDWNRLGLDAQPRTLHLRESLASIDFEDVEPQVKSAHDSLIADCPFFRVEKGLCSEPLAPQPAGRFALVVSTDHTVVCGPHRFARGQFFLLPASAKNLTLSPESTPATLLIVTLPTE
jgi:mannose-6-phosphate isomerase